VILYMRNKLALAVAAVAAAGAALCAGVTAFAANAPMTPDFSSLTTTANAEASSVPALVIGIGPALIVVSLIVGGLFLVIRGFRKAGVH
jgi:hypothetical protein